MPKSEAMAADQSPPKLLPVADEMTPAEREAYEQESLSELRKFVNKADSQPTTFKQVHDLHLTGSYPDTAIEVRWLDTRTGRERERSYPLWVVPETGGANFEYGPGGKTIGREPPSEVALLIHTWIDE